MAVALKLVEHEKAWDSSTKIVESSSSTLAKTAGGKVTLLSAGVDYDIINNKPLRPLDNSAAAQSPEAAVIQASVYRTLMANLMAKQQQQN